VYPLSQILNCRHKLVFLLALLGFFSLNPFFIWELSIELRALVFLFLFGRE
jgi:hypothetical protein